MNKITPQDVVSAIVNCFYEAHCADMGFEGGESEGREYCLLTVKKVFHDQAVDFDNPNREGILKVLNALAEFSKNFRSQDVINKHKNEIISLLNKMSS